MCNEFFVVPLLPFQVACTLLFSVVINYLGIYIFENGSLKMVVFYWFQTWSVNYETTLV